MEMTAALPGNFRSSDMALVHHLARGMFAASKPPTESLLGYALASSEWRLLGFDRRCGPVFDEVNALRALWWHPTAPDHRQKFTAAIDNLGQALRQAGVFP